MNDIDVNILRLRVVNKKEWKNLLKVISKISYEIKINHE